MSKNKKRIAAEVAMRLSGLAGYTQSVNDLARKDLARQSLRLFAGVHYDFPQRMMAYYFENGLSPRQALTQINVEAELEARAEARCS